MAARVPDEIRAKVQQMRADGHPTSEIAQAVNKSVHAVLRLETRMGKPRQRRGFQASPEIAERNKRICRAIEKGVNRATLAERYKLSKTTINMIYSTTRSRD